MSEILPQLTEKQIKNAAKKMVKELFKEYSEPRYIGLTELTILLIYRDAKDGLMEHYYFPDGSEFIYNKSEEGLLAEVEIYNVEILLNYLE